MKELTYLQTTSQMNFLTDFAPYLGQSFHLKFTPLQVVDWDGDGYPTFFGNGDNGLLIRTRSNITRVLYVTYGNREHGTNLYTFGDAIDLVVNKSGYTCNGAKFPFSSAATWVTNNARMYINATNGSNSAQTPNPVRMQTAKYEFIGIYDSAGTAVAEFVPALDNNNVCCFYDKVSKKCIYNGGTGTPISGDVKSIILEGSVMIGDNNTKSVKIGDDEVERIYIGESLIYKLVKDGWVKAIFRTTQPNENVRLLNKTNFNSMKIDGVAQQSVQNSYTFANAGDHTVELEYSSTTWSSRTFKEGNKLIKCYFGEGITNFQGDALTEQSALTEVYFAQSITGTGRANLYFDKNVNRLFGANTVDDKFWGLNGSLWCVAAAAVGSAVTIPTAFTSVNQYAFASYSGITDITFHSGITSVQANAFDNVTNVSALRFEGTTPPTFNDERNIGSNGTIYVPSGCSSTYASSNWGYLVDDYGWTISEPTPPVADSISVSANQVDNEVTFSVGFTSSTYNSIWEAQIDNTAYDDAIGQGIDPDDVDWIISIGWENTNEGNPREAEAGIPCDGFKKVYFFLYDNINDSVSTATTWSNTYNGNGDCGEPEPEPEMCGCECCGGQGTIWDDELGEERPCECCGGTGQLPCPEPEPEMCECSECNGSGMIWNEDTQEEEPCWNCGGTGQVPCP